MILTDAEKKLLYWQLAVEGMDFLEIPENGYMAKNKKSKGDRFTTFVKEFIGKALKGEATNVRFFETLEGLPANYTGEIDGNWWKQAKKLGEGKAPINSIIPAMQNPKKEEVDAVMNAFLPLYRAVKESSERRPFWQWITNHSQYVAEKETAKVLRGLLMSLTGHTESELAERLDTYCKQVNGEIFTPNERSNMISAIRDGGKIDFFDEHNEATSIEEALKKDDYEIYVAKMPKLKANDLDFDPDMDEYENQWQKEDETELENDGFEFKPEHIKKANKWGKTGNDELLSMFDAPDESSNDNIILAGENDPERMRLPLNEELVSIDGGGEVSQSVEAKSAPIPQNIK